MSKPKLGAEAFLPRIRCVFYAIFDHEQGPKVVYQVPEGSIITPIPIGSPRGSASVLPDSDELSGPLPSVPLFRSKSRSTPGFFFEFESISQYVIPKDQLCGRLVRCNTPSHRIIGLPVKLTGPRYRGYRNSFRYNVCFVFDRTADLSCYEPIVRKIGRVLLACEQESSLLSSPDSSLRIQPVLEQLYEDLNSYSETSIPIDAFNSIELQIFPFYPNPPRVDNWQVPVALINLETRKDPNWDVSMAKITPYINGVNHVQRIADVTDVSPEITRHCLEHLLFYQCIMMIDIFQYSNMYTLKSNFQWLAEETSVREECSRYVTRPGYEPVPLADLLHLYSPLKPGKPLNTWIEEHGVIERGIDVQRFITFGVIKGFLRRVHRWPVLLPRDRSLINGKLSATMSASEHTAVQAATLAPSNNLIGLRSTVSPRTGGNWSGIRSRSESTSQAKSSQNAASPNTPIPRSAQPSNAPLAAQLVASRGAIARPSHTVDSKDQILERLSALLDGSRHTDELCTMFRLSWKELERKLIEVGEGDYEYASEERLGQDAGRTNKIGRVRIIYR